MDMDKMNITSRSVQSGCSLSAISYVGFMLITANTVANFVSNLNVNSDNNDNNNNDNNNNNNNDNMNTNMNGRRSFDSQREVTDFGKNTKNKNSSPSLVTDSFSKDNIRFILENNIDTGRWMVDHCITHSPTFKSQSFVFCIIYLLEIHSSSYMQIKYEQKYLNKNGL